MKTLQIKTAQNVNIKFTVANVGQRLLAFAVDNVLKFAYIYIVYNIFDFQALDRAFNGDNWTIKAISVLILIPVTFYSLYSEILMDGQTIGKKLLKIKVINEDGFKPSITDFVMRWFLRIIDFNLFVLIVVYVMSVGLPNEDMIVGLLFIFGKLVGLLLIIITKKNQRFGDIIANTVVIYLKDTAKFSDTILVDLENEYVAMYPNVIQLSDNDVRIIKETFKSAKKYNDYKTLINLRSKIIEVTGIVSKHKSDTEFIETVLKDYNYYTQKM
ncbi:RDD family protein [Polaribacter aestuariivivens]|uniref:RDD family protein n=1 Tax=Polaribacter aestuariivivens TaxID=2304626 RepID=A0A5S3N7W4_9FLAO|nr:RDD family protein [Polaribacter aestuariivivens]TMM31227.1 RDD family protein [Polaribacter aestuariivivens]